MIEHITAPVSVACRPEIPLGAGIDTESDHVTLPTARETFWQDPTCVPPHCELPAPCRRSPRQCTGSDTRLEWPRKS